MIRNEQNEDIFGRYYYIQVRSPESFTMFRASDIGESRNSQKILAYESGDWVIQEWMLSFKDVHEEDGKLIGEDPKIKKILEEISPEMEKIDKIHFEVDPEKIPDNLWK